MRPRPRSLRWSSLLLTALVLSAPARAATTTETRFLLGTVVTITLSGLSDPRAKPALDAAFEAVAAVDQEMARRPGTALWRLNEAGGGVVSPELAEVLGASLEWARRTRGAFDPTVAPLLDLWDLLAGPHPPPSPVALRGALGRVGWERVRWNPAERRVDLGGTALDLGGIAKGYALDRAAAALRRAGVRDFLVDAGGDVLVAGSKDGTPWRVGIQHPRDSDALLRVVEPRDGVLLTSGDYQRAFSWQGETFHHLLDPRTGQPVRSCQAVTVWAPRPTAVPSAAVFLLGPEAGLALLASIPGTEALVVDARGQVRETAGFRRVAPARRDKDAP
ncbi:MAG: FAD:protein FMN transferase [Deltaproteobacteria bacterium]|nr:FAD:protein FMN transferase [Deltaproteobacteria bacterium]